MAWETGGKPPKQQIWPDLTKDHIGIGIGVYMLGKHEDLDTLEETKTWNSIMKVAKILGT